MLPTPRAAERIAAARAMYDDRGVTLLEIARFLDISTQTFARCRAAWDWPPRKPTRRVEKTERLLGVMLQAPPPRSAQAIANELELLATLPAVEPETKDLRPVNLPTSTATLAERLEAVVAAQMAQLERHCASKRPSAAEAERNARLLATLVRTLAQLKQSQRSDNVDSPEADTPDALRDELARRLAGLHDDGAAECTD